MGIALRSLICVVFASLPCLAVADTAIVSADAICNDRQMSYQDRTDALRSAGWIEGASDETRLKTFRSAGAMRFIVQLGPFMEQSDVDALMARTVALPDPNADKDRYSYWQRDGGAGTLAIAHLNLNEQLEGLTCQYVGTSAGGAVRPLLTTSPISEGLRLDDTRWPTVDIVDIVILQSRALGELRAQGMWNPMSVNAYEFVQSDLAPYGYALDYNVLYETQLIKEIPSG